MKKIHRVFALLMAVVMALGLITTAFAATDPAPTIDTSKKASLSIYKYDITKAGNPDLEKTVREAKNSTGKNTGSMTDIQKPSCDPPKTSNHQGRDFRPSLGGCPAVCRNRGGLMPAG